MKGLLSHLKESLEQFLEASDATDEVSIELDKKSIEYNKGDDNVTISKDKWSVQAVHKRGQGREQDT